MCTSARLVQADRASNWSGMSHGSSDPQEQFRLLPNQPAYLEARIDPAAHGEGGLGKITRMVYLKTAGGQELGFELHAEIVQGSHG
jgi:hypothetical protein